MVNNKDRFVRPASWEDKYEGYLFSYMETKEDVKLLVKKMDDYLCQGNYSAIVTIILKCGIVNGIPMLNAGLNMQRQMLCGDAILMEIEQLE